MGYDRGDSFLFDFKPNRIPFGSKSKGKLSPRSNPIQFEGKWKHSFLSSGSSPSSGKPQPVSYNDTVIHHILNHIMTLFCYSQADNMVLNISERSNYITDSENIILSVPYYT